MLCSAEEPAEGKYKRKVKRHSRYQKVQHIFNRVSEGENKENSEKAISEEMVNQNSPEMM